MYINNPTKEQLDSWFLCNGKMGQYLIYKLGAVLIYKKENKYYFVNNDSFKEKLKQIPFYLRMLNEIKN